MVSAYVIELSLNLDVSAAAPAVSVTKHATMNDRAKISKCQRENRENYGSLTF
jgi:hypothetical protein